MSSSLQSNPASMPELFHNFGRLMSYNMKHFRFVMIVVKSSMFDPQKVMVQDHCPDLLLVAGRGDGLKLHKLVLAAHGLAALLGEGADLLLLPEVLVKLC